MKWFSRKTKDLPHEAALSNDDTARLEIHSPTWKFIKGWQQAKLSAVRESNDSLRHDPIATAYMRGQISVYKDLANLPKSGRDSRPGILSAYEAGELA